MRNVPREVGLAVVLFAFAGGRVLAAAAGEALRFDFSPSPIEAVVERQQERVIRAVAQRVDAPPAIDGDLSDPAWRGAAEFPVWSGAGGKPDPHATGARVCYDDDALYVGVSCAHVPERPPQCAVQPESGRDGRVYRDDCVEIWITPPSAGEGDKYQLIINSAGAIYDHVNDDSKANPDWRTATQRGAGVWRAEIAIPHAALGLPAWSAELPFNVGRNVPGVAARAWNGEYGDTTSSRVVFAGIEPGRAGPGAVPAAGAFGPPLTVRVDLPEARPGERWIEARFELNPGDADLEETTLTATLCDILSGVEAASAAVTPDRSAGRLLVDLRGLNLQRARLRLAYRSGDRVLDAFECALSAAPSARRVRPGEKVEIKLDPPAGVDPVTAWPVTFGVPFPAGGLWEAGAVRLVSGSGSELPFQAEPVATWFPGGAVKWLRFDALVSPADGCWLEFARPSGASPPPTPVTLAEQDEAIVVTTGGARYVLGKGASPIREIWLGGKRVAASANTRGLYVVDQTGRTASGSANEETVVVEARGPVAACVRFEGWYETADGVQLARHITRVECFAGQTFANITHTLVLTNDTNEVWFKDIGWEFAVAAGADARAVFALSRDEWRRSATCALDETAPSAFMMQDAHYYFAQGSNHCVVARVGRDAEPEAVAQGEECGDWAALLGGECGLGVACSETARQHPKEFEVARDRIVLHLFSGRTGEELDFRAATLVRKWDLGAWYKRVLRKPYQVGQEAKVAKFHSNALGWAKTHELTVMPLAPAAAPTAFARAAKLRRDPVYALADPEWIYQTRAMGPNHPRDRATFPEAEAFIDDVFESWANRIPDFGHYGFMDYFAGPASGYRGKSPYPGRYLYTYSLRHDVWYLYARGGDRRVRDFAQGTNRTYLDAFMAHWDGPGRIRGLYMIGAGGDSLYGDNMANLPFYWGANQALNVTSSTDLNQFLYDYYLTGCRRARDMILEYAEGAKRAWRPAKVKREWRVFMMLRALMQAYAATWDPDLRAMALYTGEYLIDEEAELLITKKKPFSSSYKTQTDIVVMQEAWQLFGDRRWHEMLRRVAGFWWNRSLGGTPIGYGNPDGFAGHFLYQETRDPAIAQEFAGKIRRMAASRDPQTGAPQGCSIASLRFILQGIGYAMDVLREAGGFGRRHASWCGCEDFGSPVRFLVRKEDEESLRLLFRTAHGGDLTEVGGQVKVRQIDKESNWGLDLLKVNEISTGAVEIRIPKDAPGGVYEIEPSAQGTHFLLCSSTAPTVLHAPGYWRPWPKEDPPVRVHFNVPEDSEDGRIFFEREVRLSDPAGDPVGDGEPVQGWVSLPADKPGVWSFLPASGGLVKVANLPPFFAMAAADAWFDPGIPWEREAPAPAAETGSQDELYAPGAVNLPGNLALRIRGRRTFTLDGGPERSSGDGRRFLPYKQGTIEFWFKPERSTFDLAPGFHRLLSMRTTDPAHNWRLEHVMQPDTAHWFWTHVLHGYFQADSPTERHMSCRIWRRTIFERDRWLHIAWVWGQRHGLDKRGAGRGMLLSTLYVNGREGQTLRYKFIEGNPEFAPIRFTLEGGVGGAFDELRISDVQRYAEDFDAPSRNRELEMDAHTLALFHFNGDTRGASFGADVELPVTLRE